MIKFTTGGSTKKTSAFLRKMRSASLYSSLDAFAQRGLVALQAATPVDSGLTAMSWTYEIKIEGTKATISWLNTNQVNGVHVAVILQYGHATGSGGYVAGRDYINPAIQPIFDEIADEVWKKVTQA